MLQAATTLLIKGENMSLNDSKLKMYWTPAAPKWDMAPTYVKQVLFPDYRVTEYVHKSAASTETGAAVNDEASTFESVETNEETFRAVPLKLRCHSELDFYCILWLIVHNLPT